MASEHDYRSETKRVSHLEIDEGAMSSGPCLSNKQRAELELLVAKGPKFRQWKFLRAVQLSDEGNSPTDIARTLGCTVSEVLRWIELCQFMGFQQLAIHRQSGRARLLDLRADSLLSALLESEPYVHGYHQTKWTIPLLRQELMKAGYRGSGSTVWRAARRLGWVSEPASAIELAGDDPMDRTPRAPEQQKARNAHHADPNLDPRRSTDFESIEEYVHE